MPLRSQSAEVLAYLARYPDRLVPKEELTSAVWPDTFVTDDSLVQCIGDIRRALGDNGRHRVLTHPRRGYQLVSTPAVGTSGDTAVAPSRDSCCGAADASCGRGRRLFLAEPPARQ